MPDLLGHKTIRFKGFPLRTPAYAVVKRLAEDISLRDFKSTSIRAQGLRHARRTLLPTAPLTKENEINNIV